MMTTKMDNIAKIARRLDDLSYCLESFMSRATFQSEDTAYDICDKLNSMGDGHTYIVLYKASTVRPPQVEDTVGITTTYMWKVMYRHVAQSTNMHEQGWSTVYPLDYIDIGQNGDPQATYGDADAYIS